MSGRVNNPFAPQPQTSVEATASRFPDISQDPSLQQQQQQQQHQHQQAQYGGAYYQQQYQQPQQQQTTSSINQYNSSFQPQSSFGQQQQMQYNPTGQQHMQQQQPQYTQQGYGGPSPQVSFTVSDLDPYSGLGQLGGNNSSAPGQQGQQNRQPPHNLMTVQQTQAHPRAYVHDNKNLLMTWDEYSWKQLLARVDSLREGWEQRKSAISTLANQGADPTSADSLKREADNYIDSCHAAKMQLAEVKEGWRHSTDMASKTRVREALNAGLASLPEYPPPLSPEQLGGAFHQRAYDDQRKQSIMSSFSTAQPQQQQQPSMMMSAQQTGYAGGMGMSTQPQQQQPQQTGYYAGSQGQMGGMYMQPQQTGFMGPQQTGYGANPGFGAGYQGQFYR